MAEDPSSTNPRWWSLAQMLVWIVLRIEMPPRDAEQIANSPEMNPEIEEAWNALKREFWKSVLGVPKGIPIDKFRILCGRRYADLLTLFHVPSAEPGALSTAMDLFERDVRWQDVEYNSVWLKRTFPGPAAAESEETPVTEPPPVSAADEETTPTVADASAPAVNTEAPAAKPPESPQAVASEESPSPDKQLNDPAVGVQASVGAQRAPEQSEMPPPESPEPGRAEPTEQLTYAQIADQLGCSPEAARTLVARRRLPRAQGSDGKILVTINLREIHYRPQSARSPGGHRPMTGRAPGGHHPVAEPEMASSPPGDAMTTELPQSPQAGPVSPDAETGPEESPSPDKQPDELTVADSTSDPEMRSHDLARPPSNKELNSFVAAFIKKASDAKEIPTKLGLYQTARDALPRATRQRLFDEFERQTETPPPGRPRKNR
jgi:hypothetical protein